MLLNVREREGELLHQKSEHPELSLASFTKGFISGLVSRDVGSVRPRHPLDRQGFSKVVSVLDELVDEFDREGRSEDADELVKIANQLREGNTGGFEGFEAALRAQQLTLSRCPNPFYEEIEFPIPKVQAQAAIKHLGQLEMEVVERAAEAFVSVKRL